MSVLIRGMEMPKTCKMCDFETDELLCYLTGDHTDDARKSGRPEGCPLVEVKEPHGDLIDKNKLKHEMFFNFAGDRIPMYDCDDNPTKTTYRNVERIINEQPAVIEAEGTEE